MFNEGRTTEEPSRLSEVGQRNTKSSLDLAGRGLEGRVRGGPAGARDSTPCPENVTYHFQATQSQSTLR